MSTPRRRLVRPPAATAVTSHQRQRRAQNLRGKLDRDRAALARWTSRLKRALNTVAKLQQRIARLEDP